MTRTAGRIYYRNGFSVVVAMFTMNVFVRDFLSGCRPNFNHFETAAEVFPGQWMVAVEVYGIALDFDDVENLVLAGVVAPL